VAKERAIADLAGVHEQADGETASLLREATAYHAEAAVRLETDIADAARIRAEALAEAEALKLAAAEDAAQRVAAAEQEVAALRERTQQEFSWRKQQLRREMELLSQRKQAVLGQLASLSALAQQTAQTFPELDDLDLGETEVRAAEHDEPSGEPSGETTQQRLPAQPAEGSAGNTAGGRQGADAADEDEDEELDDATVMIPMVEPEMDGDATILINTADLPAGTEHLQRPASDDAH
jgi:hypothetical protein